MSHNPIVDIYCIRENAVPLPQLVSLLSPAERARAARLVAGVNYEEYIRARALTRTLLGQRMGLRPENVRIEIGAQGRPYSPDLNGDFNISHAKGAVMVALATVRVGVDIEAIGEIESKLLPYLKQHILHTAEVQRLEASGNLLELAGQLWTRKEACLKAIGVGFMLDCPQIVDTTHNPILHEGQSYCVQDIVLDASLPYYAALAVQSDQPATLQLHENEQIL